MPAAVLRLAAALALLPGLGASGCESGTPTPDRATPAHELARASSQAHTAAPEQLGADGAEDGKLAHVSYGAPFSSSVPRVELSRLVADPSAYAGAMVETSGKVSQVCQAMGCWMELAVAGSDERVRTPMAGHAFFLPKDVVGKQARVQARVELVALSPEAKAHLEAEGATATGNALSLSAFSVAVH